MSTTFTRPNRFSFYVKFKHTYDFETNYPLKKLINRGFSYFVYSLIRIITFHPPTKPRNTKIQYETTVNKSIQSPSSLCRPIIYGKPSSLIILKTVRRDPSTNFSGKQPFHVQTCLRQRHSRWPSLVITVDA